MITRTTRLALLLAVAVLTYARPEPVDAAMDGPRVCIRVEFDDEFWCEDCVDLGSGCMTRECCVEVGPGTLSLCSGVEACPV